jgi:hypothetical protein
MSKIVFVLLALSLGGVAQTSSDGSFSVHHSNKASFSLSAAQMREAESIYHSACAVVQHNFQSGATELHPHFMVVIGAERNEIHSRRNPQVDEIWMKKWDAGVLAQGVVLLAFDQMMTRDVLKQLGNRAVHQTNAAVDVAGLK